MNISYCGIITFIYLVICAADPAYAQHSNYSKNFCLAETYFLSPSGRFFFARHRNQQDFADLGRRSIPVDNLSLHLTNSPVASKRWIFIGGDIIWSDKDQTAYLSQYNIALTTISGIDTLFNGGQLGYATSVDFRTILSKRKDPNLVVAPAFHILPSGSNEFPLALSKDGMVLETIMAGPDGDIRSIASLPDGTLAAVTDPQGQNVLSVVKPPAAQSPDSYLRFGKEAVRSNPAIGPDGYHFPHLFGSAISPESGRTEKTMAARRGLLISNQNQDKVVLIDVVGDDPASDRLLYEDLHFDIERPVFSRIGKVLGVQLLTERPTFVPLTQAGKALKALIAETAAPARDYGVHILEVSDDASHAIFRLTRAEQTSDHIANLTTGTVIPSPYACASKDYRTTPFWTSSADGRRILSYVTTGLDPDTSAPLAILIHGGPYVRDGGDPTVDQRFLVEQGFNVLQVNYRGSAGFGRGFAKAGHVAVMDHVLGDILSGLAALKQDLAFTPSRLVLVGGSAGGYLTLNFATHPDYRNRFDGFIALNAISELPRFIKEQTPQQQRDGLNLTYFFGDPTDPVQRRHMKEQSPLYRPYLTDRPLLLIYGKQDDQVPPHQSELFAARPDAGHVERLPIEGAGHLFYDEPLRRKLSAMSAFLARIKEEGQHKAGAVQ